MGVGRPVGGITSPFKMIANIFVSFIGAGMLGLPFAYKESGIMEGAVIMGLVGYLSMSAMLMLIDCKYAILTSGGRAGGRNIIMDTKVPLIPSDSSSGDEGEDDERHPPLPSTDLTYGDVGYYALGASGKRLVDVAIIISQIGFCCGYLIYLCKNLNLYVPRISQQLWLLFLLPPLYCLTLLRHLNKLAIFSMFAQVSNVLALAVVFCFDFAHSEEVPFTPTEYSIQGFPFFFAVAIYCYEGAGMILSLEESMAEHARHKFRPIFVCTMSGLTLLYICFGVSGYVSFGPHTMDIITLNLPHGDGVVDFAAVVKICLGVSLFFTYPMMLFPVTHLLDKIFGLNAFPIRGNIVRMILVGMTGFVVTMVSNFAILMSLIGATCCTLLAFILPAAFHLAIFKQRLTRKQRYFDIMLIVLGSLGSVIALWDSVKRMNAAHDPLLDLNEFSSPKKGSQHPHAPISVLPSQRTDPVDTLANIVEKNITQAEEKYGRVEVVTEEVITTGSSKSVRGDSKVTGNNSEIDSNATSEDNKTIDKERVLERKASQDTTIRDGGKNIKALENSSKPKNTEVPVVSKITLQNSYSEPTPSLVISTVIPLKGGQTLPSSSSSLRSLGEKGSTMAEGPSSTHRSLDEKGAGKERQSSSASPPPSQNLGVKGKSQLNTADGTRTPVSPSSVQGLPLLPVDAPKT